jgi:4-hydroxy-3-methylbut-2-enyl diphosphate reductase
VFVAGKASSNGKVLSDLCRSVNPKTYLVGGPSEILPEWFAGLSTVGVCGATSTPKWLLEQVARAIARL